MSTTRMTELDGTDLGYAVEQIWGPGIDRGDARAALPGPIPVGWEVREEYWAIPRLTSAQLLVPRDARIAARTLADYARLRPLKTRLVRQGLAAAARTGVPLGRETLRIIAPRSGPRTAVAEIAASVGAPDALATFGVRTAANAKPTLELRDPSGEAVGFVKLAWNALTRIAIENESVGLRTMGSVSRRGILAPGVLADGAVDERPFVMIAPLPRGIRHVPAENASLSVAEALGPGTVQRFGAIADTRQFRSCLADLHRETTTPAAAGLARQARALAGRIAESPEIAPIANFWHGDFVWWNMGRDPQGRLWLFDWETAQPDAPAGLDTLHWFAHAKDAENPLSLVARVEASTTHVQRLLRALGHSPTSASILAAWYSVTLVAGEIRLAESLGSWDRIKHPAAVLEQLLTWGVRQFGRPVGNAL